MFGQFLLANCLAIFLANVFCQIVWPNVLANFLGQFVWPSCLANCLAMCLPICLAVCFVLPWALGPCWLDPGWFGFVFFRAIPYPSWWIISCQVPMNITKRRRKPPADVAKSSHQSHAKGVLLRLLLSQRWRAPARSLQKNRCRTSTTNIFMCGKRLTTSPTANALASFACSPHNKFLVS